MLKFLRKYTAIPAVKYSVIAIASLLWIVGFADQLPDVTQTAKYVGISLLMVAVAAMGAAALAYCLPRDQLVRWVLRSERQRMTTTRHPSFLA